MTSNGVPTALRRVLHRALDLDADPGHAARETRGDSVRATPAGFSLRALWQTRAAGGVREFATVAEHVRRDPWRSDGVSREFGSGDEAGVGRV